MRMLRPSGHQIPKKFGGTRNGRQYVFSARRALSLSCARPSVTRWPIGPSLPWCVQTKRCPANDLKEGKVFPYHGVGPIVFARRSLIREALTPVISRPPARPVPSHEFG